MDLESIIPSTEPIYAVCKDELLSTMQDLFESGKLVVSGTVTVAKFMERKDVIYKAMKKVLNSKKRNVPRRQGRDFKIDESFRRDLYSSQGGRFPICDSTIDESRLLDGDYVHIDHIVPWSKGGPTTIDNAALTHAACNRSKGSKMLSADGQSYFQREEEQRGKKQ